MKLYVCYTSPIDDMAFDAVRGMVLVHWLSHIEFCKTAENCDLALILVSAASDFAEIIKTQKILQKLAKEFYTFHIHGNRENLLNKENLCVKAWDEQEILNILKK